MDLMSRHPSARDRSLALWGVLSLLIALDSLRPTLWGAVEPGTVLVLSLPSWVRAAAWGVAGCAAIVAHLWRTDQRITRGFQALVVMPSCYAGNFLVAAGMGPSLDLAMHGLLWASVAGIVMQTAGTGEHPSWLRLEDER